MLALLVLSTFAPVLTNGFVNWDDYNNFVWNYHYRGFGWAQIRWAWTSSWVGVYQPIAWMLLEVEYTAWGLRPWGYHLVSVILHALNAIVLYRLLAVLTSPHPADAVRWRSCPFSLGSALAATLFAVHPLRVEVVAWASCQPYLPCALFSMLMVLAYIRATGEKGPVHYLWLGLTVALAACALLSKAAALGVLVVPFVLDLYPLKRFKADTSRWFGLNMRSLALEKVPFLSLGAVFAGVAVHGKQVAQPSPVFGTDIMTRLSESCYAVVFYIFKTVFPFDLSAIYPRPEWKGPGALAILLSVIAVAIVSLAAYRVRGRRPWLLAVWASYLLILAPHLGLARVGNYIAADRYSYIASIVWCVPLAAVLDVRLQGRHRRFVLLSVLSVSAILAVMSWQQCQVWRDSGSLWSHSLAHGAGRSYEAHILRGTSLNDRGRAAEALAHFEQALMLQDVQHLASKPGGPSMIILTLNYMASTLTRLGVQSEFENVYRREIERCRREYPRDFSPGQFRYVFESHLRSLAEELLAAGRPSDSSTALLQYQEMSPDSEANLYLAARGHALCIPLAARRGGLTDEAGRAEASLYTDRAVDALRRSIAAGLRDVARLQSDPAFEPIRDLTAFRELVVLAQRSSASIEQ